MAIKINKEILERNNVKVIENTNVLGNVIITQNGIPNKIFLLRRYKESNKTKDVIGVSIKIGEKWSLVPMRRIVYVYYNNVLPDGLVIIHKDDDQFNCHPTNLVAVKCYEI